MEANTESSAVKFFSFSRRTPSRDGFENNNQTVWPQ
jgi:hypothetical protein